MKKHQDWENLLNISHLRDNYALVSNNCHIKGLTPNKTELSELAEAIRVFEEWVRSYNLLADEDKKAVQKALKDTDPNWSQSLISGRFVELRSLQKLYENAQQLSQKTRETIQISVDIAERTDLSEQEKAVAKSYEKNMRKLAQEQISGSLAQERIETGLTPQEMASRLDVNEEELTDISGTLMFDGDIPVILIGENTKNAAASRIHETQHLIQFQEGKLVFANGRPLAWTYDLQDEIEAYRIQYLFAPDSLPEAVENVDAINAAYVRKFYPELPEQQLSLESTLEEIDAAIFVQENKPSNQLKGALATIGHTFDSYKKQKLKHFFELNPNLTTTLNLKYKQ